MHIAKDSKVIRPCNANRNEHARIEQYNSAANKVVPVPIEKKIWSDPRIFHFAACLEHKKERVPGISYARRRSMHKTSTPQK